jgi:hypothetical protein
VTDNTGESETHSERKDSDHAELCVPQQETPQPAYLGGANMEGSAHGSESFHTDLASIWLHSYRLLQFESGSPDTVPTFSDAQSSTESPATSLNSVTDKVSRYAVTSPEVEKDTVMYEDDDFYTFSRGLASKHDDENCPQDSPKTSTEARD